MFKNVINKQTVKIVLKPVSKLKLKNGIERLIFKFNLPMMILET